MRFASVSWPLLALAVAAGCSGRCHPQRQIAQSVPAPGPYVRIAGDGSNSVQLEIALREFVPKRRGATVWLCAVSHIGEGQYYAALQRELEGRSLVLFEGVSARAETPAAGSITTGTNSNEGLNRRSASAAQSREWNLQSAMAKSLGLVFQLDALDYTRPNFLNSDLSVEELRKVVAEAPAKPGERTAAQGFEGLMQLMQGGSLLNSLLQLGFQFISTSPKLQAMSRYMLIEILADLQGDPAQLGDLPSDLKQLMRVLVQRRNEKVIADLAARLPKIRRGSSVAVMYGAGHMPDLQKRLCQQLSYRPARQVWLTAFGTDLAKSGVTDTERRWAESLVKSQLKMMQPSNSPTKE